MLLQDHPNPLCWHDIVASVRCTQTTLLSIYKPICHIPMSCIWPMHSNCVTMYHPRAPELCAAVASVRCTQTALLLGSWQQENLHQSVASARCTLTTLLQNLWPFVSACYSCICSMHFDYIATYLRDQYNKYDNVASGRCTQTALLRMTD